MVSSGMLRRVSKVVPSASILVTLMIEALNSSKTSILTRATRHNIPEDAIILSFESKIFWRLDPVSVSRQNLLSPQTSFNTDNVYNGKKTKTTQQST
jgi:hypothetical protein